MRYRKINNSLFRGNRKRFCDKLLPGSIAVFFSNDHVSRNADETYPFVQNSNLFYLTGIDQEKTMLLLYPDAIQREQREILFIRRSTKQLAIWEGHKITTEQAKEISGIEEVIYTENFESLFLQLFKQSEHCYLDYNEHPRASVYTSSRVHQWARKLRRSFPSHSLRRSAPVLARLRSVKTQEEISLIKEAIEITGKAFSRILRDTKPGIWEFELEAGITHEFIRNRATGHAYPPIVATGKNACVLHYISNASQCKDGELLLLDFGAEYANYSSDLTRTIPVNGKFTKRQRNVYKAVLTVMNQAKKLLKPGMQKDVLNEKVGEYMTEELLKLKLLKKEEVRKQDPKQPAYKKYFMHGISHFLGLDTHDVGMYNEPFTEGMIFTCEPGIYIPNENLGIRLENDILITNNGNQDLTENIPVEADEIESLMQHT